VFFISFIDNPTFTISPKQIHRIGLYGTSLMVYTRPDPDTIPLTRSPLKEVIGIIKITRGNIYGIYK
jgi:hypothetical protein